MLAQPSVATIQLDIAGAGSRTGDIRPPVPDVAHGMSNLIVRRAAVELRRLRFLGPVLLAAAALIVAACNNGSGGTGY